MISILVTINVWKPSEASRTLWEETMIPVPSSHVGGGSGTLPNTASYVQALAHHQLRLTDVCALGHCLP